MRAFTRNYLLPWLFVIGFWFAVWILVPATRENLNAMNLFAVLLLLVPFLFVALYFAEKAS